jgi:hypothetical protein
VNRRTPAAPRLRKPDHNIRSTDVSRRRGRLDRCTRASWCRRARISKCSEARERTMNRSEWSREKRTDDTNGGYRTAPVTSIDATRTAFSVTTGVCPSARDNSRQENENRPCRTTRRCIIVRFQPRANRRVFAPPPSHNPSRATRSHEFRAVTGDAPAIAPRREGWWLRSPLTGPIQHDAVRR